MHTYQCVVWYGATCVRLYTAIHISLTCCGNWYTRHMLHQHNRDAYRPGHTQPNMTFACVRRTGANAVGDTCAIQHSFIWLLQRPLPCTGCFAVKLRTSTHCVYIVFINYLQLAHWTHTMLDINNVSMCVIILAWCDMLFNSLVQNSWLAQDPQLQVTCEFMVQGHTPMHNGVLHVVYCT